MTIVPRDEDTICAVATPHGRGGISVIRISGPHAEKILRLCCEFLPESLESHHIYYGYIRSRDHQRIDEVLVSYFQKGRSFTGEVVFEVSCHGSPLICDEILRTLVELGARPAERGEFTYRAFMNGRLDLAQAEGVLELIDSETVEQKKIALRQLGGQFSDKIRRIEDQLTRILAHVEADIDFSADNLETLSRTEAASILGLLLRDIQDMLRSYEWGRKVKDGLHVVLVGSPNVGKSTLFNSLVGDEKAIVTPLAGTTRDVLSEEVVESGFKFSFFDTAGIRIHTDDLIEKIGIDRSRKMSRDADCLFFVVDASRPLSEDELSLFFELPPERTVLILNKMDLLEKGGQEMSVFKKHLGPLFSIFFNTGEVFNGHPPKKFITLSATDPHSRAKVFDFLLREISYRSRPLDDLVVINSRHFEALSSAASCILAATESLREGRSLEFLALELKDSLLKIQSILGIHYDDQILDRVFKEFCLGK